MIQPIGLGCSPDFCNVPSTDEVGILRTICILLTSAAMLVMTACSDRQADQIRQRASGQISTDEEIAAGVVIGFGGGGGRRGTTGIHLRSGELTGFIRHVQPGELDCKVGDRIAVRRTANIIVALPGQCRKGTRLPT